ncbi:MAG: hypothetical protein U5L98_08500 [Halomonas sp.]|nr:hypothetical protein [Halomonas sp.]MDZ7852666.1 hypothetical protein [Halomonas sp.]
MPEMTVSLVSSFCSYGEGEVLLLRPVKHLRESVLRLAVGDLDGDRVNRLRQLQRLERQRVVGARQGIVDLRGGDLGQHADVACDELRRLVDLLALRGVDLRQLLLLPSRLLYVSLSWETLPPMTLMKESLPENWSMRVLKHRAARGPSAAIGNSSSVPSSLTVDSVTRAGEGPAMVSTSRNAASPAVRVAEPHTTGTISCHPCPRRGQVLDLVGGKGFLLEVLGQQIIVALGGGFDERSARLLGLFLELVGYVGGLFFRPVARNGIGFHLDKIDDAPENPTRYPSGWSPGPSSRRTSV